MTDELIAPQFEKLSNILQGDNRELVGIDINLWMYTILEFLNPMDLFFGISKCCKLSRGLVDEYLERKIKARMETITNKDKNSVVTGSNCCQQLDENDIIYFALQGLRFIEDDDFEVEMQGLWLDLAKQEDGFYEYCLQQHIVNLLKRFEKEWTSEGLFQIVLSDRKATTNQDIVVDSIHNSIFENEMQYLRFYKSNLKSISLNQAAKDEESEDKKRRQCLSQESYEKYKQSKVLKCPILGYGGIGKTTLCKSLNIHRFDPHTKYLPTIGCCVSSYNLTSPLEKGGLNIALWDMAGGGGGGENFGLPRDVYAINANYTIIAFDLTFQFTFRDIDQTIKYIRRVEPTCKIIVVGTKSDLVSERKVKSYRVYRKLASYKLPYIEISSKLLNHNCIPVWFFYLMETLYLEHH